jgi:hypothetical protein
MLSGGVFMAVDLKSHENPRIDVLTNAGRLRWIMENFTQRDLNAMTHEAIEAIGDDLRHAAAPWWPHNLDGAPMMVPQVHALQQDIRQGLQAALGKSVPFRDAVMMSLHLKHLEGWELPPTSTFVFLVDENGDSRLWKVDTKADERAAILKGVADLLYACRDQLCTCPACGALFVRHYRQGYCSTRCSNKVRNRRRLDRRADQQKSGRLVTTSD